MLPGVPGKDLFFFLDESGTSSWEVDPKSEGLTIGGSFCWLSSRTTPVLILVLVLPEEKLPPSSPEIFDILRHKQIEFGNKRWKLYIEICFLVDLVEAMIWYDNRVYSYFCAFVLIILRHKTWDLLLQYQDKIPARSS